MSDRRLSQIALVALCVCGWLAAPAGAAEWFVAPGGTGSGSASLPFGHIQDAVEAAHAGDLVTIAPGTYAESIVSVRSGTADAPITLRATRPRTALVTHSGRVLTVGHAYVVVDGLVLDGQYGTDDTVRIAAGATGLVLRNTEVRRSSRDLIDMGSVRQVRIEGCLVHHALDATDGRTDAHGIVAGAVTDLVIRDTEIHTFSGDGVQVDPGRSAPGWDRVTIEGDRIWLAPLPRAENGFAAGTVPGENAVDTKAAATNPRSRLTVRNTVAFGFRNGLIPNMAAFNLKENIEATLDGITVFDSEIAFRLRGAAAGGARVAVMNAVIHDVATAFRYEDGIRDLRLWNDTVGRNVERVFQAASARAATLDVRNMLSLAPLTPEARHPTNLRVTERAFVDARAHDYHLRADAPAIDAGDPIGEVTIDRDGVERPQGASYDVGAYERPAPAAGSGKP